MPTPTFLQSLSRLLNCPKVHVSVAGLVTTWFAVHDATADLPPTQRSALWVAFIGAVAVVLREIVNAWTEEDVAAVTAGAGNAGAAAAGSKSSADSPPPAAPAASISSEIATTSASNAAASPTPAPTRSTDMPPRTALPLILVVSSLIALFSAGCQTSPELTAYREGLHQVDEPLYQAHLLLLDDAVKANLRTAADQQVVQQGINAAEAIYQQSRATEAAGTPTTQP